MMTIDKLELLKSRVDVSGHDSNGIATMSLEDYEWLIAVIELMQQTVNEKVVIEANYLNNLTSLDKDNKKLKDIANKHYVDMVYQEKKSNRLNYKLNKIHELVDYMEYSDTEIIDQIKTILEEEH